ncbi:MAG: hypothetical protein GXP03_14840 [Alphaproteobacteria bacterium]|nr:hypothetical protein [Alphaproteobacteria bacterium]
MMAPFPGEAGDRLLPPFIPFRFFLAASLFQVLAWLMLVIGAGDLAGFTGGLGPVLAAVHLLTLGVLAMVAMGASYQLLPIATRQSLVRVWPTRLSFWLMLFGIPALVAGLGGLGTVWLAVGTGLVSAGLLVFAALSVDNLRRAGSMPLVAAHGWAAMAALFGLVALGIALVVDFGTGFLVDRSAVVLIHMSVAAFGFMGFLVLGFSHVLIPMFALSRRLPAKAGWAHLWLGLAGLVVFSVGVLMQSTWLPLLGSVIGLAAISVYIGVMVVALKTAMRKRLGLAFVLIRTAWGLLGLSMVLGLILLLGVPVPNGAALFGFLLLAGWLLTFLMGVLQRIMPFLASMHAAGKGGKPPRLSELTPELPARVHAVCHFLALAIVAAGILLDATILIQAGALIGLVGALAFTLFAGLVAFRMARS